MNSQDYIGVLLCPYRRYQRFYCSLQYLKGAWKKVEDRLFSRACYNKTRNHGFKLEEGIYKEEVFTIRIVKHLNRLL